MKKSIVFVAGCLLVGLALIMLLPSCGLTKTEPIYSLEIISKAPIPSTDIFASPGVTVTVKNTGKGTVYNSYMYVKAKNTSNEILDAALIIFAGFSSISAGESATGKGYFFHLSSENDYASLAYEEPTFLKR